MPVIIDAMRAEFANYLSAEPYGNRSIDDALRHVLTLTYECGLQESRRIDSLAMERFVRDILDPEAFGWSVT